MRIREDLPRPIRNIEHFWIPLPDGTRLSARLWLPEDAERHPVPAILEFIPYRKRDGTRGRDEPMHAYFAGHGYAAIRVDQRGSGESDGLLMDEYLPQEQEDAIAVIAWLARQKWCDGSVGMMGKSWGGFNCLQVAAHRPPALKAVLSVCSTDDRYADDIHYMGGCLLNDNLWWGTIMLAYQARPADPELRGPDWRANWQARLEAMPFWPALWMAHPDRDAYWRQGSICEDWSAIDIPVLLYGGWADAYTNAIPRMLAHLDVPRQGVIGPWAHLYAHSGQPGPAIGFLQQAVAWWDRWLKGVANGVEKAPMLRAFLQDPIVPGSSPAEQPGHWVAEDRWPSSGIADLTLHINAEGLSPLPGAESRRDFRSPLSLGLAAGEWMGAGCPGEAPGDQRLDDAGALVFDSAPLGEALPILGAPEIEIEIASDKPVAQLAVRLCDVDPDGRSLRVSYGVLNLTHRDGSANPQPLVPSETYRIRLKLNACGHRFPTGHRLRLALSTSYWPLIWPAPETATLTIALGTGRLVLPKRSARAEDGVEPFAPPESAQPTPMTVLTPGRVERRAEFDFLANRARYVTDVEGGVFGEGTIRWDEIGLVERHDIRRDFEIGLDDPSTASYVCRQSYLMQRDGLDIRIAVEVKMTSDAETFFLVGSLDIYENGARSFSRDWRETFPRHLL